MEYRSKCIKFDLPNGNCVDILNDVFWSIKKYIQFDQSTPESADFLLGYQNRNTNNITISDCTIPQARDVRKRLFCVIKDTFHFLSVKEKSKNHNYYVGVWHTHPQQIPEPSSVDWQDWNETLLKDTSGTDYFFFIILGTNEFRIWVGDSINKKIVEIFESKTDRGIYIER